MLWYESEQAVEWIQFPRQAWIEWKKREKPFILERNLSLCDSFLLFN